MPQSSGLSYEGEESSTRQDPSGTPPCGTNVAHSRLSPEPRLVWKPVPPDVSVSNIGRPPHVPFVAVSKSPHIPPIDGHPRCRAVCAVRALCAERHHQDRCAASGVRGAVLFRPAGPPRRHLGNRGDQRGGRHQVARRRQLEAVLGDARSTPEGGISEVERMAGEGVAPSSAALPARSASPPARPPRATTFLISSMSASPTRSSPRGLTNTFRFAPGLRHRRASRRSTIWSSSTTPRASRRRPSCSCTRTGCSAPASPSCIAAELPKRGFEVLDIIAHPTPVARHVATSRCRSGRRTPISSSRRAITANSCCSRAPCSSRRSGRRASIAVLNGAASNYRFVKEFPEAAQYVMDTNHWYDPRNAKPRSP